MPHYRIVLAEDDSMLRDLYERVLRRHHDYGVRTARNGEEALELIRIDPPHLLLLDIDMPVLDGFGVLERLPRPRPFTVAMLTNFADQQTRQRAAALGSDVYLVKMDLSVESFLAAVALLLEGRNPVSR